MMKNGEKKGFIPVLVLITYLIMVVMNALANLVPLNGITTGEVSDSYPNLFAPAGITFTIWGLIYILLGLYTLYQWGFFQGSRERRTDRLLGKVGVLFALTSLTNALWIIAWHYRWIPISLGLMLFLLVLLIAINLILVKAVLTGREAVFIRLPFQVYFGWITVATIANVTVFLVDYGLPRTSVSESLWTIVVILVGALIGILTMLRIRSKAYGIVLIWAYMGIQIKHTSPTGFDQGYPSVIMATLISIVLFTLTEVYLFFFKKKD